jgi:hypothetical protein
MSGAPPSANPADEDSLAGLLGFTFKKLMQSTVDNMLPCQVIGVSSDRTIPRVQVQHLILKVDTTNATISRGQVASIPVLQLGGGGFVLSFPVRVGDLGWIKACDRDISTFLSTYNAAQPQTYRQFNFSDALFIPDVMHGYIIAEEDQENVVLQSVDGTVKIALSSDKIIFTAPQFEFNGPALFKDQVTIEGGMAATGGGDNSAIIAGNLLVTGNQRVDGDITAGGDITPNDPG